MPIVDKINALTGKSAETIEDAIANMSGGSGGGGDCNVEVIRCAGVPDESAYLPTIHIPDIDVTLEEICEKLESGKMVFFDVQIMEPDDVMNYFIPICQMGKWSEDGVNGFSITGSMISDSTVVVFGWDSGEAPGISLLPLSGYSGPGGRV